MAEVCNAENGREFVREKRHRSVNVERLRAGVSLVDKEDGIRWTKGQNGSHSKLACRTETRHGRVSVRFTFRVETSVSRSPFSSVNLLLDNQKKSYKCGRTVLHMSKRAHGRVDSGDFVEVRCNKKRGRNTRSNTSRYV